MSSSGEEILRPGPLLRTRGATGGIGRVLGGLDLHPLVAVSAAFVLFLIVAALVPGALAGSDPLATSPAHRFLPPTPQHLLGTDENGRDVWARLIWAVRPSLLLGLASALITTVSGTLLGLLAGLSPRLAAGVIMRFMDVLQSFPEILLVLVVASFCGTSTATLLLALGSVGIPRCARQVRAQVLVLRRAPFVEAAETLGLARLTVVRRHVLPNAIKPMLAILPIDIGWKITAVAMLSFLGLGAPPPAPDWGAMLAIDREYVLNAWWLTAIPAVTITLAVLAINTLGRDLVRRSEGRAP